jgi:hypothetical protein
MCGAIRRAVKGKARLELQLKLYKMMVVQAAIYRRDMDCEKESRSKNTESRNEIYWWSTLIYEYRST